MPTRPLKTKTEKLRLKKKVFAHHLRYPETKFYKYHMLDPEFPKHSSTIKSYIEQMKKLEENGEKVEKSFRRKIERETSAVYEYLENDTAETIELLTTLKEAIKKKAITAGDDRFTNIRDIATAYGIIIDKEILLSDLNIKREKLQLERDKIKFEREKLETKLQHPEAFAPTVTIINDAPRHELPKYTELIDNASN